MPHDKNPIELFPDSAPFWNAAAEGRLLIKRCEDCGERHFYPRPHCPFCASARVAWEESSPVGRIYSFSVPQKASERMAVAVVELESGVRLTSVIVECDVQTLSIGQLVEVHWRKSPKGFELAFTTQLANRARVHAAESAKLAAAGTGFPATESSAFQKAAVVGAGTMGTGITMAMVNVGIPVILVDRDETSLKKAIERIAANYSVSVQRGRLTAEQVEGRMGLISISTKMSSIASADVVIEAVWEQLALKREIFAAIDAHARPGALLGTNTSMLDVNRIADATSRATDVIGLHFFTPAQTMKLLEVVRGSRTSDATVSAAMALGRRLDKCSVLVEVCPGFVGNRIFGGREREARRLLLEGATPEQVDRVLTEFGMPMGSFEIADMTSGVELSYRKRQESGEVDWLGDRMFLEGRVGQKAGKGYYRYEAGSRKPLADPAVLGILEEGSRELGIDRKAFSDEEILERLVLPMINEGAKIIEEGVVERAGDVDAVWVNGYGWPTFRGGPMYYADQLGASHVLDRLLVLEKLHGERFRPSALLEELAKSARGFRDLPSRQGRAARFLSESGV